MWPLIVRRSVVVLAAFGLAVAGRVTAEDPATAAPPTAPRVVSMNPSLTRMLVGLGAIENLVGVDEYSANSEPAVAALPRVGGLFNPSLEAVVALQPDLVVIVPSLQQRDFRARLGELGVEVLELSNLTLDELLQSIETLGQRVGRSEAAGQRVAAIRSEWKKMAQRTSCETRHSAVLVVQRDPLFVAGGGSYLDAMLEAAGLDNAAARYPDAYPRVAIEWLIAAAPGIIIDSAVDPVSASKYWSRWPSIPAVAENRVVAVPQGVVTLPGPFLDRSLRTLVTAVEGSTLPTDGCARSSAP